MSCDLVTVKHHVNLMQYNPRYRKTVHARDLDNPGRGWVKMPDLPDARMWQGCVVTQVSDQRGIMVIGGR